MTLRRALAAGPRGRGKRVAPGVKSSVRAYALKRREQGATFVQIGSELGLSMENVRRWTIGAGKPEKPSGALPVRVVAEPARRMTVVSPTGFRVEGLSLHEAAALLRALG